MPNAILEDVAANWELIPHAAARTDESTRFIQVWEEAVRRLAGQTTTEGKHA